jgi:prepilin-type N-terminal cleavage/methylation domain-containing protein
MKNKFTLIEMLVVMVILSILVTLGVSAFNYVTYQNKLNITKTQMNKLELALEQFRAEYGDYYFLSTVENGTIILHAKPAEFNPMTTPAAEGSPLKYSADTVLKKEGGIVKFCPKSESDKNEKDGKYTPKTFLGKDYSYYTPENSTPKFPTGFRDGWGNLFIYQYPGENNETKYDLWSRGPDGEGLDYQEDGQNDDDDICNWKVN